MNNNNKSRMLSVSRVRFGFMEFVTLTPPQAHKKNHNRRLEKLEKYVMLK